MYIYKYMYIYIYRYMYVYIHKYIYTYIFIYIYIYIYIYTYIFVYIYIYIYICIFNVFSLTYLRGWLVGCQRNSQVFPGGKVLVPQTVVWYQILVNCLAGIYIYIYIRHVCSR